MQAGMDNSHIIFDKSNDLYSIRYQQGNLEYCTNGINCTNLLVCAYHVPTIVQIKVDLDRVPSMMNSDLINNEAFVLSMRSGTNKIYGTLDITNLTYGLLLSEGNVKKTVHLNVSSCTADECVFKMVPFFSDIISKLKMDFSASSVGTDYYLQDPHRTICTGFNVGGTEVNLTVLCHPDYRVCAYDSTLSNNYLNDRFECPCGGTCEYYHPMYSLVQIDLTSLPSNTQIRLKTRDAINPDITISSEIVANYTTILTNENYHLFLEISNIEQVFFDFGSCSDTFCN